MCNKCESTVREPATPLLARWTELSNNTARNYLIRDHLNQQHRTENIQHWSHARRSWTTEYHPEQQKRGHEIAKQKSIVNKIASQDATTSEDMEATYTYLKYMTYINEQIARKIEPTLFTTLTKLREEWEGLDIMNKLHPYVNDHSNSSHDAYANAQMGFVRMNMLHQIHLSTEDINQIAYYPTLAHMRAGREVRTRLGRYLTKYQQAFKLTDTDIKSITEKHQANMRSRGGWSVEFIEHNDEGGWMTVYDSNDVGSCMKGMDAVRVYAHDKSVLRLAYVKAGEKIIARCIVREDDAKGWLRVYPDPNGYAEGRYLLDYLKANGYDQQTSLDGALLRYITEGGSIVCPYIDYGSGGDQCVGVVERNGVKYLEVGRNDYSATNTNGYVEDNSQDCDECGDSTDSDDLTYIEHSGNNVCPCCRDNNYTYAYGSRYEDFFPEDECVRVNDNWYWRDTIHNHDIGYCEHSGEYYPNDEIVNTYDGDYHQDYVVSVDRHTDYEYVYENNVHTLSDGTTCHEDDADHYQAEIDDAEISADAELEA